jgi:hypothetical protein
MKHTLRCHDFGEAPIMMSRNGNAGAVLAAIVRAQLGQDRASPQGVAATIAVSFVARLANTVSIGFTSLRAIDNSGSQRTRVSSC